jgi:hypothetical protein
MMPGIDETVNRWINGSSSKIATSNLLHVNTPGIDGLTGMREQTGVARVQAAAQQGTFTFSTSNYRVSEGRATATITIKRTGNTAGEARVNYATANGIAIAGTDYTKTTGTLVFTSGQTSKTFKVAIKNDAIAEPTETIKLTLSKAIGARLGSPTTATLSILDNDTPTPPSTGGSSGSGGSASIVSNTITFSRGQSEAAIAATGAARIKIGTQTIYIGTQQVSSINQNPIIASFDRANPANNWVRTDYETTGADGRGNGLFWDGSNLYGVFCVDGTQGTPNQDFRRASAGATQSWLRSYGAGGGPKVAVLAKLDPRTGALTNAAYLSARLSSGKSNSLAIADLSVNSAGNLVVKAKSFFAPRRPDGSAMTQTTPGKSPFDYTVVITKDLKTVISTAAVGWR